VITLYEEDGLHYLLFKGQSVITLYREEDLHYQLVKGQSIKKYYMKKKGFITNYVWGSP
jgi:hypothetical protein